MSDTDSMLDALFELSDDYYSIPAISDFDDFGVPITPSQWAVHDTIMGENGLMSIYYDPLFNSEEDACPPKQKRLPEP